MKKLYFLNEEEKNRILNLHESATKRQYLGEEQTDRQTNINKVYCGVKNGVITAGGWKDKKWDDYVKTYKVLANEIETAKKSCPKTNNSQERQTNINKVYCGVKNGVITAGGWKDKKWDDYVKTYKVLANEIETAKKSCPKTNNSPQNTQQIVTKTSDITKQIQKLLGINPETGVMDSGLLQKINDKLNGGGTSASTQATSASTQATSASTQAYNFNIDPNIGKDGINFNQMTPEEKVQGVQSATPPQEPIAATTAPTNKEKRQEIRDLRAANKAEMQALRDKQRGNQ